MDDYESRVRGGHNFNLLRISDKEIAAPGNRLDILVCINKDAYDIHKEELRSGGIAIVNAEEIGKGNKTYFEVRITSYNVCYTKLLRSSAMGKDLKKK